MFGEYPWGIDDAFLTEFYKRVDLAIITAAALIVLFVGYITVKEIIRNKRSKNAAEL